MIEKIALGTAQFGMDYGIANTRGKVPKAEVFKILEFARNKGLRTLDTSVAYGESEVIIGEYTQSEPGAFNVITKILLDEDVSGAKDIEAVLRGALNRLNVDRLYGCLIHRFEDYFRDDRLWEALEAFKKDGYVGKIGFSLYKPEELDRLWERGLAFDIVQVPYSLLDRRFAGHFKALKNKNVEVHVRSVFLQGLALMRPEKWPERLRHACGPIEQLKEISRRFNVPMSAICLNYVLMNPYIDKAVIGVDSLKQLEANVSDLEFKTAVSCLSDEFEGLAVSDESVLLPFHW